jgi:hypothetical protein
VVDPLGALPMSTESFADIGAAFDKDAVASVIPLFQCEAMPELAFAP